MVERPRNVSASFVDFAKRSWISRSPSPSPLPTPKTPTTRKAPGSRDSSGKEKENGGLFGGKLSRIRPVPSVLFSADHRTSKDDSDARPRTANPVERDSRTSSSSGVSSNKASSANGGESALNTGRLTPDTVPRTPTTNNATSGVAVAVTAAAPAATTSNSSSSRALTRASEYLTRIKQRPQSMFVKFDASTSSPQIDQPSATSGSVSSDSISDKDNNSNDQTENDQTQKAQKDQIDQKDQIGQKDQNQTDTTSISTASDGDDSTIGATSSIYLPLHLPTDDEAPAVGRTSLQTSTSSGSSSDECSANDSTAQPASEAESLTTADTSHHSSSPMAPPTSRDPLWVAFKDLETNFFKFLSKTSTPQRIVLVRAALVPFLRRYALDSSNKNTNLLSPEDIERRASILNRWWTALLDMLDSPGQWQGEHGQLGHGSLLGSISSGSTYFPTSMTASGGVNGYGNSYGNNNSYNSSNSNGNGFVPLSGIDRPVVLEGLSMIMSRPEWRLLTNVFRPLIERSPGERVRARSNTNDSSPLEDSNMFVEESAEHNVRNMFVNNLLAQLVLVVDKMTMRHAPLSIVNFAGKVCAYAFYFVPGVADILVRLWGLDKNIELVRRAADAFGLPRRSRGESEDLIALFPPVIGSLGWSSVNTMHAKLRRAPKTGILGSSIVVACNRIPWYAPSWLARWRGAETDLFFIFCKYYHLLADEFMPSVLHLPLVEKARAPAYVLVHAQLLQILDNTIHRQAAVEAAMMANPMNGFSEGQQQQLSSDMDYASANASASDAFVPSMLLQPNHNLFREMDENRIIALLRDFLSADASLSGARDTFAESIMTLLKAAAFRTSQYDNNACYMLCDFLHELLLAFDEYNDSEYNGSGSAPIDFVDWTFWLDVCKMMLSSNNTMSEIRVLSFVFSAWDVVTADPARKEALCIQWLLSEDVFDKMFNNWCPMVRAYYMRLLCWRMCRDTGRPNDLDAKIFLLVSERLVKVWSHYLWLKQKADRAGQLPPSTVPSLPQPGKRFMIVRTEVNVPQLGLLANNHATNNVATTFDAMQIPFGGGAGSGADYSSTSSSSSEVKQATDGASARKKWSLLGKVLNFTGSASTSSKLSNDDQLEQMRRDTAASRSSNPLPPPRTARLGSPSSDSDSSTGSTPVFESTQYVFKFMLHNIPWQNFQGGPGGIMLPPAYRERIITRPRLPALAQARVSTRMNTNTNTNTNATHHRRSESPPPSAGLPAATRRVSGAATGGLIDGARNADPSETVPTVSPLESRRRSSSSSFGQSPIDGSRSSDVFVRDGSLSGSSDSEYELQIERPSIQPVEPKGHDALLRAKYAGRALAEWSLVVNECNSFVDRRRDEGVFGLGDIEVPSLGVESLRRLG